MVTAEREWPIEGHCTEGQIDVTLTIRLREKHTVLSWNYSNSYEVEI